MRRVLGLFVFFAVLFGPPASLAADRGKEAGGFRGIESRVQEFRLPNGMTFLVLERHEAPIFSFRTYVNAGGSDEVAGITGIAHMFEHMAFKGTPHVGAEDPQAEARALEAIDAAYAALLSERQRGRLADSTRIRLLTEGFQLAQREADRFVVSNEFAKVLEQEGAHDLNAFTSTDATQYLYDLPSNKLELWALMEGDRLTNPVLREFYKERDVVIEERRMHLESAPSGRLFDEFIHAAFAAHPYGNGLIGHRSDLETISREQALRFYQRHYVAKNIVVAVVGDVEIPEVRRLAETYFPGVSDAPAPPPVATVEPPQRAERRLIMEEEAQPLIYLGYHMPDFNDPRYLAYEALADILGSGRSSRLHTRLVKEAQLAVHASLGAGFPGEKYPNLLFGVLVPASGIDPDSALAGMDGVIERLLTERPITQEELDGFKTRTRARFLRRIDSNQGMAGQLAYFHAMTGDWRNLFRFLESVDAVDVASVMEAARECLRRENRTVGILRNRAGSSS